MTGIVCATLIFTSCHTHNLNRSNSESLFFYHHFPLSWKEWLVDPAEQFYYVWLRVMILPIVYNSVIIILRYKTYKMNHICKHITCNDLIFCWKSVFWVMFSQDLLHYNCTELPARVVYAGLPVRSHVYVWHDHHHPHRWMIHFIQSDLVFLIEYILAYRDIPILCWTFML